MAYGMRAAKSVPKAHPQGTLVNRDVGRAEPEGLSVPNEIVLGSIS